MEQFAARLLAWQRVSGRRDLPWLSSRDPYRVWLSEIMLQQTQVATVVPYYLRFVARFPDVFSLASAALGDVMPLWAGLGYYARARNLHRCAVAVVERYDGRFPQEPELLQQLPGIGRSTAAAIAAFCFDARAPILDGNVRRVLARHAGIEGDPTRSATERVLWERADTLLPSARDMPAYTQAMMDLGATVCTRTAPRCEVCPVERDCVGLRCGRIDELPTPRVRKKAPTRTAHMLFAVHDGHVLLVERPPTGVWGGLLSAPQFDAAAELRGYLRRMAPQSRSLRLPARRHAFTHFTLEITPHLAQIASPSLRAAEPNEHWLPMNMIETAALPAPIRALLQDLRDRPAKDA